MKKILLTLMIFLFAVSFVSATGVSCSNGAVNMGQNPSADIVLCDDPTDQTCEQDFVTLCPANWHLCSATEYNVGNDNWQGNVPTWLLGEIQCRDSAGAGHYTVSGTGAPFLADVLNNNIAGSSLPECQSDYGCNEQQYYALCCYGSSGGNDNPVEDPVDEVPEFGVVAAGLALIGALGIFIIRRRH